MGGSKNAVGTSVAPLALPETEAQAPGKNGLYRLNYFNGRILTGEGLRKEQVYWDYRARLLGEIHPPGVAWGLGLEYGYEWKATDSAGKGKYQPKGGMSPGEKVTLNPGLAFNGIGQPIAVGAEFEFTFAQLMDQFKSNKTVVIDGGTSFFPCVCLAPMPCGDMPAGQALAAGPYLLLIDPKDSLEGEAKVYSQVCPGPAANCEKDGIRGGFSLSLARFPVDVPMESIEASWDLRSILSAYYFGVYELSLISRWARPFPLDEGNKDFCQGPGPFDRVAGHVPLAMVYVGSDGTILFVDPWIPRRSLTATASAGWHANLRGAPTGPAVIARLHQFQCQVHDRFLAAGWPKDGGKKVLYFCPPVENAAPKAFPAQIPNLYDLGFREIPPYGFLPIPPNPKEVNGKPGGTFTLGFQRVQWASKAAKAYFKNTNVLVYSVVALHDDDIFEDMVRAAEKDSIVLHRCLDHQKDDRILAALAKNPIFGALFEILGKCGGLSMEKLINREIEVVKIVVPMEGLRRKYPLLGAVKANLSTAPYATWTAIAGTSGGASDRYGPLLDVVFGDLLGGAARPHGFVFYVKQRLVLLEALYIVLDVLLDVLLLWQTQLATAVGGAEPSEPDPTESEPNQPDPATPDSAGQPPTGPLTTEPIPTVPNPTAPPPVETSGLPQTDVTLFLQKMGLDDAFAGSLMNSFAPIAGRDRRYPTFEIGTLRAANAARPLKAFSLAPLVLEDETTRKAAVSGLLLWAPELGLQGTWSAYSKTRTAIATKLRAARPNDPGVEGEARDQAIDLLLQEHKGFAALKLAAVTLPDAEVAAFEELLQSEAKSRGSRGESTLGQQVFYAKGYQQWTSARAKTAFEAARVAYGRRTLQEVVPGAAGLPAFTVEKALSDTTRNLTQVVGGRASDRVSKKIKADGVALQHAVTALGASKIVQEPTFWNAYDEILSKNEGNDEATIARFAALAPEFQAPAKELKALHATLGEKGYEDVLKALRGKG